MSSDMTDLSTKRSILALMSSDGTYQWAKRIFASITTEINAIAFRTNNDEVIAVMGTSSDPWYMMRFKRSDGSLVKGYVGASTENMAIRHGSAFEYGDYLYLGIQNTNSRAFFLSFYLRDTDTNANARIYFRAEETPS